MTEQQDWLRAYVLMGQYLGAPVAIQLGPGGLFYAVLRGQGPTGLQTVKVDEDGRLSAFVIDSSDAWGRLLGVGNAELAVRLGSPVAYDRRGQVVFVENFEHGWGLWSITYQGADYAHALDPTTSMSGGYSFKLTAGNASGAYAGINMIRALAPTGKMGLEFVFSINALLNYVGGRLVIVDGARMYTAEVRYGLATNRLELWNHSGAFESPVATAPVTPGKGRYSTLKFVIDTATQKYERVLFNDVETDLTAYSYYDDGVVLAKRIEVEITNYGRVGNNDIAYIDDIIVTLAEPANPSA